MKRGVAVLNENGLCFFGFIFFFAALANHFEANLGVA
jgi:hypothetical protein